MSADEFKALAARFNALAEEFMVNKADGVKRHELLKQIKEVLREADSIVRRAQIAERLRRP
jgi:hypothetical protein